MSTCDYELYTLDSDVFDGHGGLRHLALAMQIMAGLSFVTAHTSAFVSFKRCTTATCTVLLSLALFASTVALIRRSREIDYCTENTGRWACKYIVGGPKAAGFLILAVGAALWLMTILWLWGALHMQRNNTNNNTAAADQTTSPLPWSSRGMMYSPRTRTTTTKVDGEFGKTAPQ